MSDKVIRWTTVDGECVTHHAMRVDDGGEQCIRCRALTDVLHVGFLCGNCRDAELQTSESTSNGRTPTRNAMSEWIPVGKRLPDRCLGYLVSTECYSDAAIIAYWNHDGRWMDGRKDITDSVTHWMALPITPVEAEMMSPMSGQPSSPERPS